jgi:hypothetical protein
MSTLNSVSKQIPCLSVAVRKRLARKAEERLSHGDVVGGERQKPNCESKHGGGRQGMPWAN